MHSPRRHALPASPRTPRVAMHSPRHITWGSAAKSHVKQPRPFSSGSKQPKPFVTQPAEGQGPEAQRAGRESLFRRTRLPPLPARGSLPPAPAASGSSASRPVGAPGARGCLPRRAVPRSLSRGSKIPLARFQDPSRAVPRSLSRGSKIPLARGEVHAMFRGLCRRCDRRMASSSAWRG
jgi:hypothetical protein